MTPQPRASAAPGRSGGRFRPFQRTLLVLVVVAGCEQKTWFDAGPGFQYCLWETESQKMSSAEREASRRGMELLARSECDSQLRTFAGEMRCEHGVAQVRCR
jgi:hypothetical protein